MSKTAEKTRWTMIIGAANGRTIALTQFARRYDPIIRRYLATRWRGRPHASDLDDAAQDVFVDCFKDDGALCRVDPERPGGFRAFLYGIVQNVARRFEEKRARRREVRPPEGFDIGTDDAPLERVFDREWAKSIMLQAKRLHSRRAKTDGPDARRRVDLLRLRFEEGRKMNEIALEWQMDRRRLQYEYDKARREFEAALHEVVRRHHPNGSVESECARLLSHLA